jgi:arylsulfatase A-like enzyme
MVYVVDWAVGQVARLLDELGLTEDTLFIVTSDNGADLADYDGNTYGHRSNGHWRGQKGDVYEGGHRVPFIGRWPGRLPEGAVTDELFCLVDLLPTLASATGARLPAGSAEDAYDVLEVIEGTAPSPRSDLVHHSLNATFCLRSSNWKLVMGSGSGGFSDPVGKPCDVTHAEGQLYDLAADPDEAQDLWASRQDLVETLYRDLKRIASGPASGLSYDVPVGTVEKQPV